MKIIGKHKVLIDWAEKEVRTSIQMARELGASEDDIKELENQLTITSLKFESRLVTLFRLYGESKYLRGKCMGMCRHCKKICTHE
jgi:hypothetical protein